MRGSVWLQARLEKLFAPGWTRGGLALKGFWSWATYVQPGPHPPMAFSWYGDLLCFMLMHHFYTWFAWVITLSELTVFQTSSFTKISSQIEAFFHRKK